MPRRSLAFAKPDRVWCLSSAKGGTREHGKPQPNATANYCSGSATRALILTVATGPDSPKARRRRSGKLVASFRLPKHSAVAFATSPTASHWAASDSSTSSSTHGENSSGRTEAAEHVGCAERNGDRSAPCVLSLSIRSPFQDYRRRGLRESALQISRLSANQPVAPNLATTARRTKTHIVATPRTATAAHPAFTTAPRSGYLPSSRTFPLRGSAITQPTKNPPA